MEENVLKNDDREIKFSEWFDPKNVDHIRIYNNYLNSLPSSARCIEMIHKLPRGIFFDVEWQSKVEKKMIQEYIRIMINKED